MENVATSALENLLDVKQQKAILKPAFPVLHALFRWILMTGRLDELHRNSVNRQTGASFLEKMLQAMHVSYELSDQDREQIPSSGPLVVVANHPFGGIEGVVLGSVLLSVRPDVRIMANHLLRHLAADPLLDNFIFVDPFAGKHAARNNLRPLRETLDWLTDGGALGVFPAGAVSHPQWKSLEISDPRWSHSIIRIARRTNATLLPVFFEGRNSLLFHLLGMLHPRMRTVLLAREMVNKEHSMIRMRIGRPISLHRFGRTNDREISDYIRMRTYLLRNNSRGMTVAKNRKPHKPLTSPAFPRQVAEPQADLLIREEVAALSGNGVLLEAGRFTVYLAAAAQIPNTLREIGRLREITFREAGEGTGKEVDTDRFDEHYLHLFLWNHQVHELVGAYRLGPADRLLAALGKRGLYTSTLFDYDDLLLDRFTSAIEIGRSFVRGEYQKDYHPLMLLWRGIGRFISLNPHYRMLFGPVSITNDYLAISRHLIMAFCRSRAYHSPLAAFVTPKHPPRNLPFKTGMVKSACRLVRDTQELSELISDIEKDRKGIPILLKHYMKLGGEFLGFNVDRNFNNALDALILVDLVRTDRTILNRYMGKEQAAAFLNFHSVGAADSEWNEPVQECV